MTRAMNSLILTRAHYRRRYGNAAPEMSIPSRFLEEVPSQLVENLGGGSPAQSTSWSTPGYPKTYGRRPSAASDFTDRHYNYEDESQEIAANSTGNRGFGASAKAASSKPFVASWMTASARPPSPGQEPSPKGQSAPAPPEAPQTPGEPDARSIDNIARFFGGKSGAIKPGALPCPAIDLPTSRGAINLKKGQHIRHAKYGEGTVLLREGDGEDAKLTVMFARHGLKKLMEKFANLQRI